MMKNFRKLFRLKRDRGNSPRRKEENQELSHDKADTSTGSQEENPANELPESAEKSKNDASDSKSRQKWTNKLQNLFCVSSENQENKIHSSESTTENQDHEGHEVTPEYMYSEPSVEETSSCTPCVREGIVHFDELTQINPDSLCECPQPMHSTQIVKRKKRRYVRVKTKPKEKETIDDKNRLFEIAFNVELRRIFIKVPYFFNTFKNELQGKIIGRKVATEVDETKLRISIERMIAYMWPLQKEHVTPFVDTLPDDCDMNKAVNYFRKQMKKSYGAYIKNFPQMMGIVAHMYFDKAVPLDLCLKVYRVSNEKSNSPEPDESGQESERTPPAKYDKCIKTDFQADDEVYRMSTTIANGNAENYTSGPVDLGIGYQERNITDDEADYEQDLYSDSDNNTIEVENENIAFESKYEDDARYLEDKTEETCPKSKGNIDSSKAFELPEENVYGTATSSDAYFEIGQYRLDESINVGKCKKGSKREFESSAKKKIKSRGVPNKHLKNEENLLLENALEDECENCEYETQDNLLSQLQDEKKNLQAGDASVSDFADFYVIPDEDAEPDMRHKESDSCLVIRGKKGDCDILEETYKVGERKSNKPRRQQQKRKNKKETIFLSYNMNNNASSEDVSDTDSVAVEYSYEPLIEDDGLMSENDL